MMSNKFNYSTRGQEILDSEIFGEQYSALLEDMPIFNSPLYGDIESIYNAIHYKYENLSNFQTEILKKLFEAFNSVREMIDPNRLKHFDYFYNEDEELLIYRKSDKGLTNLILADSECIAYSFIGKDKNTILEFYDDNCDFEKLSYLFFSN